MVEMVLFDSFFHESRPGSRSGKFASVNQPSRHVWFLAGKIGSENKNIPKGLVTSLLHVQFSFLL